MSRIPRPLPSDWQCATWAERAAPRRTQTRNFFKFLFVLYFFFLWVKSLLFFSELFATKFCTPLVPIMSSIFAKFTQKYKCFRTLYLDWKRLRKKNKQERKQKRKLRNFLHTESRAIYELGGWTEIALLFEQRDVPRDSTINLCIHIYNVEKSMESQGDVLTFKYWYYRSLLFVNFADLITHPANISFVLSLFLFHLGLTFYVHTSWTKTRKHS